MRVEVADEIEVRCKARVVQHVPGVAADREHLAGLHVVVFVEHKAARVLGHGASVDHGLAEVFAGRLQRGQFEQAIGGREEAQVASARGELRVGNLKRAVFEQARVGKAVALGKLNEVVPVKRATQALAIQHRVVAHGRWHAAVGIHVREIKLAARFEQALHTGQHRVFVGRKIDNAVGHDHVEAGGLQTQLIEPLDVAVQKPCVAVAKDLRVVGLMGARHGQLFVSHVHADHLTRWADQLCQRIDVAARAAAQIEHAAALKQRRAHQAAAVVARQHLGVHAREQRLEPLGHGAGVAAGTGFKVCRALQLVTIVVLDEVVGGGLNGHEICSK